MCTNPVGKREDFVGCFNKASLRSFVEKEKKRQSPVNVVYVSGGEPTIRPDFLDSFGYISRSFPLAQINLLSNGRRFFYADFAKKCLSFPHVNFIIPIHGWDGASHDSVTGMRGSFDQTVGGLKNLLALRRPGQQIEIRVIIHKINYKNLTKIFDFLLKEFPSAERVVAVFLEYEGHAIENFNSVKLSYKYFYPEFKKLKKYLKKFREIRFYHFPLCAMPEEFWPHMWRTLEADEIVFLPKCANCEAKKFCLGIHENYLKLFGESEFKPLKNLKKYKEHKYHNFHHPIVQI